MTMPAPSSAPPPYYAPRRSHGCLWGCLIVLLIVALPPMLLGGYGAWFFWQGFHRDPVLRVVSEMVRKDGMAQEVLGPDAQVVGVESSVSSWMPGGSSDTYDVTLEGPKGEGHLAIIAHHGAFHRPRLDSAILTGPDGHRYDLLKHQPLPDDSSTPADNSI
jgi:hypothetical protein